MAGLLSLLLTFAITTLGQPARGADESAYDIVVYGGTSAGVVAAVQGARMGKSVVLIEPKQHLGGLTISGLGMTDTGNKSVIGGVSREFYQRVKSHYDQDSAWQQEQKGDYSRYRASDDAMWTFEPHVAEQIYEAMLAETDVHVLKGEALDRRSGVKMEGPSIQSITLKSGKVIRGKRFIDSTYEGDLMAAAGVSYTVGRESNEKYGETLNGVQIRNAIHHQFTKPVDPYVKPGDPSSGLLPGINTMPGTDGQADDRVQAYNYRICMTDAEENRVPFDQPAGYDPVDHELLLRNFEAGDMRIPLSIAMMPNRKTDLNNNFAVSTDWIGMNYDYPEADDETREEILKAHETYVRGFLWTLQNSERIPQDIRDQVARWGYSKNEFPDNGHFGYWCYIREARRMVSDYVQTEMDCRRTRVCDDSVGLGSYNMDSHNCQRYVDEQGHVRNEGDVQVSPRGPYLISYKSIVPRQQECDNLFVPVCLSSSHIAYGSIRMEPVFMILGQSAATAASLSIDHGQSVQDVEYAKLRERLLADKQVLDLPPGSAAAKPILAKDLRGIVVDDPEAKKVGSWLPSSSVNKFVGESYLHDGNEGQGEKSITYQIDVPEPGRYEVRIAYTPNGNRATNVPVVIHHQQGESAKTINERKTPELDGLFTGVGLYSFEKTATIVISNKDANGYVVVDAVQLLKKK
ncbi:MAG: FAD-dependent oxidoreductase [Planctomycetaceae bacterium]|nr:FAD-dependent oxidoreductase [Planctomycetaceae bacterium]